MITTLLMLLQTMAPAIGDVSGVDLPPVKPKTCRTMPDDEGEIIVCGRENNERYRLRPLTTRYDGPGGPGIGFRLAGGHGNAYSTQIMSPDQKPDKRIMVRVVFPF